MIKTLKIALTLLLPALLTANFLLWRDNMLGSVLVVLFFGWSARATGEIFFKSLDRGLAYVLGLLASLAYLIILGSFFFYIWQLSSPQMLIITWLGPVFLSLKFIKIKTVSKEKSTTQLIKNWPLQLGHYTLIALYLLSALKATLLLSTLQMAEAIRSPWEIIPSEFFITYALLCLVLILIYLQSQSYRPRGQWLYLLLGSVHLFLTYSLVLWAYEINFGFDPFVHQATENILLHSGTISPKPFLYIGHYSLVNWAATFTGLNLILLDRLLVPLLTALLLPAAFFFAFTHSQEEKNRPVLLSLLGFPILLMPFYFSVPQNLANLFLLLTVLLAGIYLRHKGFPLTLLWLLAAATALIHPFSGLPLLVYVAIVSLFSLGKPKLSRRQLLSALVALIAAGIFILPLALIIAGDAGHAGPALAADNQQAAQLGQWVPFYSVYHLVYLIGKNHALLLALLAAGGLWLLWKKKQFSLLSASVFLFLILSIDVSILELLKLPIIDYELPEFIGRFWQIGLLFLTPLIFTAVVHLVAKSLNRRRSLLPAATVFFIILTATTGLYLSYPRVDGFTKTRAYATSSYDIAAVRWIQQDAAGRDYVVLANQAVAAAALQEFGFQKYFRTAQGELFYYPIPTTSPLYDIYLDMVYISPSKNRLEQAMEMADVETGYFVVNDYWLDYAKIVEQAKVEFTNYEIIDDKLAIFKLQR
jgi:hypothetical protein